MSIFKSLPGTLAGLAIAAAAMMNTAAAEEQGADTRSTVSSSMSGKVCRIAYFTAHAVYTIPDISPLDNVGGGSVILKKGCAGAVFVEYFAETNGDLSALARATCLGSGGFSNACAAGAIAYSSGFGTQLYGLGEDATVGTQGHAAKFIFKGLKRGKWKIDILLSATVPLSYVEFRSMVATAYVGG